MYKNENEILSCFRQLSGENQIKLLSSARLVCKSWESGAASVRQEGRKKPVRQAADFHISGK
jgi:hypothetical protein